MFKLSRPFHNRNFTRKMVNLINYEKLNENRIEEVTKLMNCTYFTQETVSKTLGLNKSLKARQELDDFVRSCVRNGFGTVAFDHNTKEIVGVELSRIWNEKSLKLEDLYMKNYVKNVQNTSTKQLLQFTIETNQLFNKYLGLNTNFVEIVFVCVHANYQGLGICKELVRKSLETCENLLKNCGIKRVIALTTTDTTFKVLTKFHFQSAFEMQLKDLKFDGQQVKEFEQSQQKLSFLFNDLQSCKILLY